MILPNLLVGEYPNPLDVEWLKSEHQVTAVMSLQDDADLASKNLKLAELKGLYARHGLRFEHAPVQDGDTEGFALRIDEIVVRLHTLVESGARAYVHCNAGMNRAPPVAIAYLHVHHFMPLLEAHEFVKDRRSCQPYMQMLRAHYRG